MVGQSLDRIKKNPVIAEDQISINNKIVNIKNYIKLVKKLLLIIVYKVFVYVK